MNKQTKHPIADKLDAHLRSLREIYQAQFSSTCPEERAGYARLSEAIAALDDAATLIWDAENRADTRSRLPRV